VSTLPAASVPPVPALSKLFITGASSGIGQALAEYYAAQGAQLGLCARRGRSPAAAGRALAGAGALLPARRHRRCSLARRWRDFIGRLGVPDIVIANAGISRGTLSEHAEDLDAIRRVMDTNFFGMAATFSPFIGGMRRAGRGRLVGIASVAGIRGLPGSEAYSASKAAAISYLESLRVELRLRGQGGHDLSRLHRTPMTERQSLPDALPDIPADAAAPRFARAIEQGRSYVVVPWQMGVVARLLRLLPNAVYDRLLVAAPRKPRQAIARVSPVLSLAVGTNEHG
jgi:short-subunit dehydrogenase